MPVFILASAAVFAIVSLLIVFQIRLGRISRGFTQQSEALVEEMRNISASGSDLESLFMVFVDETNEIRKALRLPETEISFGGDAAAEAEGEDGNDLALYLQGVDLLVETRASYEGVELIKTLSAILLNEMNPAGYEVTDIDGVLSLVLNGNIYLRFTYDGSAGGILMSSPLGESSFLGIDKIKTENILELGSQISAFYALKDSMESELLRFAEAEDTLAFLEADDFVLLVENNTTDFGTSVSLMLSRRGRGLFDIYIRPSESSFLVAEKKYPRNAGLLNAVKAQVNLLDVRSPEEIRIEELRAAMELVIADSAFSGFLSSRGLELVDRGREDTDYFYYDLFDSDGKRVGAFGVQK
ncbi:MAG: hypothetical protein HN368_04645, partial [Spirochaetales bacterium]|nr:hypothetical protein [Spirochaetales bacterium]